MMNGVNSNARYGLQNMPPRKVNRAWVGAPKEAECVLQERLSGGAKRDLDETTASTNSAAVAQQQSQQPKKKNKITYALPNQSMEQGHFYVVLGEDVDVSTGRYKILSLLGQGTFGKVVECWDRKRKQYCALKIVRNVPKYTRDATVEIQYMEKVAAKDPEDHFPFIKPMKHFLNDQGHMCIVMPKYGMCLLDCMQRHGPFSLRHVAEVAFQCGVALDFLHTAMRMIHTDLKPENILLESNEQIELGTRKVRICDLGGCTDEHHSRHAVVSTRHYRAPEVVCGLGWMYPADMWSMGCILYELATSKLLFDTHDNLEHVHIMCKVLGPVPESEWAAQAGTDEAKQLFACSHLRPPATASMGKLSRLRHIREALRDDELLVSLIQGLLHYDKNRRLTARQMAQHPFVLKHYPESVAMLPPSMAAPRAVPSLRVLQSPTQ